MSSLAVLAGILVIQSLCVMPSLAVLAGILVIQSSLTALATCDVLASCASLNTSDAELTDCVMSSLAMLAAIL